MGTSQSRRDPRPGQPLIPPWASSDLPAPGELPPSAPPAPPSPAPDRRYQAFRTTLGSYVRSGDASLAKQALGHWARTSRGGSSSGTQRQRPAIGIAAPALAGLVRAANNLEPEAISLDIRELSGLPADEVIDRIVDTFCPPGVLDHELARLAMQEALARALEGIDTFDIDNLNPHAVATAIRGVVAELVFVSVMSEAGRAFSAANDPVVAVRRERDLRQLVREVVDVMAPALLSTQIPVSTTGMRSLLNQLMSVVLEEIVSWE